MGTASSKLKKYLSGGDEYAALQLYKSNKDLRKSFDPNLSYGENHGHDTPLHLVSRNGLKALLRLFLFELSGNPNKKNTRDETSLHTLCSVSPRQGRAAMVHRQRFECLNLLLQWKGAARRDGTTETVDLAACDKRGNTALHNAACSGLESCVMLLVENHCPLFVENKEALTSCDLAEKHGHADIAKYLEFAMVFGADKSSSSLEQEESVPEVTETIEEAYKGLRPQDIQEAKDHLLVETADMLSVPLFHAEVLLRNHEWSKGILLEEWMKDSVRVCTQYDIPHPDSLEGHATGRNYGDGINEKDADDNAKNISGASAMATERLYPRDVELTIASVAVPALDSIEGGGDAETGGDSKEAVSSRKEVECEICTCPIEAADDLPFILVCRHVFCTSCWKEYLTGKIQDGDPHNIRCPGFMCSHLVPVEHIEKVVARDVAHRYLKFDIKAFVESNPELKWCPHAGCKMVVKRSSPPGGRRRAISSSGMGHGMARSSRSPSLGAQLLDDPLLLDTLLAVDCGSGHRFCWECLGEAHDPCTCEQWKQWEIKISDIKPTDLNEIAKETETAANQLWLVGNSKKCPNCKSHIEKNDGCNHMRCAKCKHDFCWVCLEGWKKHNSSTGGYFRCTRFEVSNKAGDAQSEDVTEAEEKHRELRGRTRFIHYYTRYSNHLHSYKFERPLLDTAQEKLRDLRGSVSSYVGGDNSLIPSSPSLATTKGAVSHQPSGNSRVLSPKENHPVEKAGDHTSDHGGATCVGFDEVGGERKTNASKFVGNAVQELLKSRQALQFSYVYGFYLEDEGIKKDTFEFLQNQLELSTERLSEMLNRPYLRTPRATIIQSTQNATGQRHEFCACLANDGAALLAPPPGKTEETEGASGDSPSSSASRSDRLLSRLGGSRAFMKDPKTGARFDLSKFVDMTAEDIEGSDESGSRRRRRRRRKLRGTRSDSTSSTAATSSAAARSRGVRDSIRNSDLDMSILMLGESSSDEEEMKKDKNLCKQTGCFVKLPPSGAKPLKSSAKVVGSLSEHVIATVGASGPGGRGAPAFCSRDCLWSYHKSLEKEERDRNKLNGLTLRILSSMKSFSARQRAAGTTYTSRADRPDACLTGEGLSTEGFPDTPSTLRLAMSSDSDEQERDDPALQHVLQMSRSVHDEEEDDDLSLAIELSLQESVRQVLGPRAADGGTASVRRAAAAVVAASGSSVRILPFGVNRYGVMPPARNATGIDRERAPPSLVGASQSIPGSLTANETDSYKLTQEDEDIFHRYMRVSSSSSSSSSSPSPSPLMRTVASRPRPDSPAAFLRPFTATAGASHAMPSHFLFPSVPQPADASTHLTASPALPESTRSGSENRIETSDGSEDDQSLEVSSRGVSAEPTTDTALGLLQQNQCEAEETAELWSMVRKNSSITAENDTYVAGPTCSETGAVGGTDASLLTVEPSAVGGDVGGAVGGDVGGAAGSSVDVTSGPSQANNSGSAVGSASFRGMNLSAALEEALAGLLSGESALESSNL